jgi:hypothetical protein
MMISSSLRKQEREDFRLTTNVEDRSSQDVWIE